MAEITTDGPWARLSFADGSSYRLTTEDVLWAARAAVYEGGDPAATLWTMAQRFEKLRHSYPSFASFVRAFSQPVNPAWSAQGQFCGPGGSYETSSYCSPEKLQRRRAAQSADWENLERHSPDALYTALAWAAGELQNPVPRATNFADETVARGYLAHTPGASVLLVTDNWYIVEPWAQSWSPNHVVMVSPQGQIAGARTGRFSAFFQQVLARAIVPINPVRFWRA